MRNLLLALIAFACVMPVAADAARRDERGTTTRTAQAAKANPAAKPAEQARRPAATPTRQAAAPSRQVAAPSRQAAVNPRTAPGVRQAAPQRTQTARIQDHRGARQQVAVIRPGDVRSQRSGIVIRGAQAATISRESAGNCTRRNGRTVCGPRDSVAGWQSGLPVADNSQRSCPAGTFATLARGHDDIVRCMPI